jgi:WD40 repeat protein
LKGKNVGMGKDIVILLKDATYFVEQFKDVITASSLQTYTATTFMPQCLLLDKSRTNSEHSVRLVSEREAGWGSRNLRSLEGHTNWVMSVAFSPDGKHVVSGSYDKTMRIWEMETGREVSRLEGNARGVTSVAFSSDGKHVVSGSYDETVRIWEMETGREVTKLEGHTDVVASVSFSPDGKHVVSGSYDCTVRIWETDTGREVTKLEGHTDFVRSVAFSPDGKHVVSGSDDMTVRIWETETGREVTKLEGHTDWVMSVAFSPDGNHVVSGSDDKTVRIWETDTGREVTKLDGHISYVTSVAFSPDGSRITSEDRWGKTLTWTAPEHFPLPSTNGFAAPVFPVHPTSTFAFDGGSGWLLGTRDASAGSLRRLCMVPAHRRPFRSKAFAFHGCKVVMGAESGAVTILDCSRAI